MTLWDFLRLFEALWGYELRKKTANNKKLSENKMGVEFMKDWLFYSTSLHPSWVILAGILWDSWGLWRMGETWNNKKVEKNKMEADCIDDWLFFLGCLHVCQRCSREMLPLALDPSINFMSMSSIASFSFVLLFFLPPFYFAPPPFPSKKKKKKKKEKKKHKMKEQKKKKQTNTNLEEEQS